MKQTNKKKAIGLSILFLVSYCALGFFGALMHIYQTIKTGVFAEAKIFGGYHITLLISIPLYFLPLAISIYRIAKESKMNVLKCIFLFAIIVFSVFLFFNFILVILYFVNPGLFA